MVNANTEHVIAAIISATYTDRLSPALFTHCFGRAATSAAFRIAKQRGLIEINYISCAGSPVWKLTASAKALVGAMGTVQ